MHQGARLRTAICGQRAPREGLLRPGLLYAETCLFASSCVTGSCGLWLFHRRIQQGRTPGKTALIDDGVIRSFLHRKSVEVGSIKKRRDCDCWRCVRGTAWTYWSGRQSERNPESCGPPIYAVQFRGWRPFGMVHHHCFIGAFLSGTDKTDEESQARPHISWRRRSSNCGSVVVKTR